MRYRDHHGRSRARAANRKGNTEIAVWPRSFAPGATLLRMRCCDRHGRSRARAANRKGNTEIAVWPRSFAPGATLLRMRYLDHHGRSRAPAVNSKGNAEIAAHPRTFAPGATLLRIRYCDHRGRSRALAANRKGSNRIAVWPTRARLHPSADNRLFALPIQRAMDWLRCNAQHEVHRPLCALHDRGNPFARLAHRYASTTATSLYQRAVTGFLVVTERANVDDQASTHSLTSCAYPPVRPA